MHLVFQALEVTYSEVLGGDIVQVSFHECPEPDVNYPNKEFKMPPPTKHITISTNYEFPPCDMLVDWCDGEQYGGVEKIAKIKLTKTSIKMVLENGFSFYITFETDDLTYRKIQKYIVGNIGSEF